MGGRYRLRVDPQRPVSGPLWSALRAEAEPRSIAELHLRSRAHPNAIQLRLRRWVRAGFVVQFEGRPKRFAMSSSAPDVSKPPLVAAAGTVRPARTARDRLWAAMRVLKTFDVPLLMMTAEASRRSCEDFVDLLRRAGYVRHLAHGTSGREPCAAPAAAKRPGPGQAAASRANLAVARDWSTYQLVRSTGPRCPTITNSRGEPRRLIDRNTGAEVELARSLRASAQGVNHVR